MKRPSIQAITYVVEFLERCVERGIISNSKYHAIEIIRWLRDQSAKDRLSRALDAARKGHESITDAVMMLSESDRRRVKEAQDYTLDHLLDGAEAPATVIKRTVTAVMAHRWHAELAMRAFNVACIRSSKLVDIAFRDLVHAGVIIAEKRKPVKLAADIPPKKED